jgi:hypothetical protein
MAIAHSAKRRGPGTDTAGGQLVNVRVAAHVGPGDPAYEERFLFLMLTAVRNPAPGSFM